jgi:hypothetical protein
MAEAAAVLASTDTSRPVRVRITRLGKVVGPGRLLAWASLEVKGFSGSSGLHATLAFEGLQAFMAKSGEVALAEQRATVMLDGVEYAVANIPVEAMEFEASWRLC